MQGREVWQCFIRRVSVLEHRAEWTEEGSSGHVVGSERVLTWSAEMDQMIVILYSRKDLENSSWRADNLVTERSKHLLGRLGEEEEQRCERQWIGERK